jgi:hypothetical protein
MDPVSVHADRTLDACVSGSQLPWQPSPSPGVQRRVLERIGGEVALATSIVRYAAGSRFEAHLHAGGEEFLVLEGVFSDEHGHYPAGTYVRNPPGSAHAPFSTGGCVIFVKLRQMAADETRRVVVPPGAVRWAPAEGLPGHERALLYARAPESVALERLPAGGTVPPRQGTGGDELFVVEGSVQVAGQAQPLARWGWRRSAAGPQPGLSAPSGALLWIKRGHLG